MKWMIASDIHGSAFWANALFEAFAREGAEKMVLLGDLLYHGPRNDLPRDYAPKQVLALLNAHKEKLLCVRGNCDTEVDQMVLEFPILADYAVITVGEQTIYVTHGHNYGETNPPAFAKGASLLCGHTHVPACRPCANGMYLNPGSVSIPKEGSAHGYMLLDEQGFTWHTLEGECYGKYSFAEGGGFFQKEDAE